jgi:hypothetical protein
MRASCQCSRDRPGLAAPPAKAPPASAACAAEKRPARPAALQGQRAAAAARARREAHGRQCSVMRLRTGRAATWPVPRPAAPRGSGGHCRRGRTERAASSSGQGWQGRSRGADQRPTLPGRTFPAPGPRAPRPGRSLVFGAPRAGPRPGRARTGFDGAESSTPARTQLARDASRRPLAPGLMRQAALARRPPRGRR